MALTDGAIGSIATGATSVINGAFGLGAAAMAEKTAREQALRNLQAQMNTNSLGVTQTILGSGNYNSSDIVASIAQSRATNKIGGQFLGDQSESNKTILYVAIAFVAVVVVALIFKRSKSN